MPICLCTLITISLAKVVRVSFYVLRIADMFLEVFRELILGNSEFVERTRRMVKVGVTTRTGKCNF